MSSFQRNRVPAPESRALGQHGTQHNLARGDPLHDFIAISVDEVKVFLLVFGELTHDDDHRISRRCRLHEANRIESFHSTYRFDFPVETFRHVGGLARRHIRHHGSDEEVSDDRLLVPLLHIAHVVNDRVRKSNSGADSDEEYSNRHGGSAGMAQQLTTGQTTFNTKPRS